MDLGGLVGSVQTYANNAAAAVSAFQGNPAPVAVSPQQAPVVSARPIGAGAMGTGMTIGGIAVVYLVLRWLGLLPRWLRII